MEEEVEDVTANVSNAAISIVEVENRVGSPRLLGMANIANGSDVERTVNVDLHPFLGEVVGTQRTGMRLVGSTISRHIGGGGLGSDLVLVREEIKRGEGAGQESSQSLWIGEYEGHG